MLTVKKLREITSNKPENLTQEEFDKLPVFIYTGEDTFHAAGEEESGVLEFMEDCNDELGKHAFALVPFGELSEEEI